MSPRRAGQAFLFFALVHTAGSWVYSLAAKAEPLVAGTLFSFVFSEMLLFLPFLAAALLTPASFREMFPIRKVRAATILLTILATVLIYPAMIALNAVTLLFGPSGGAAIGAEALKLPFGVSFVLIAVVGPVMEELAFRGYLRENLGAGGRKAAAAFLSALLFGLAHGNINQACYACLMGIYLAFLANACGSILPGILAHAVVNGFGVCAMYAAGEAALQTVVQTGSGMSLIDLLQAQGISTYEQWAGIITGLVVFLIFAILMGVLAFLVILLIRYLERRSTAPAADAAADPAADPAIPAGASAKMPSGVREKRLFSIPLVIGIVIMAVVTLGLYRPLLSFVQNL